MAQSERLALAFEAVGDAAWCMVGNGLSNQVFVEGPEGIIAIDSGESTQEMQAALDRLREVNDRPIVAVIYTHSHYVGGTQAIVDEAGRDLPVWAHAKVTSNRQRAGLDLAPVGGRGLVNQFGMMLPEDGPDALVNCGLGNFFRNPSHAPHTDGFVTPTSTFSEPMTTTLAGLDVEFIPAPSDDDSSITIWFPALRLAVNNLLWPAFFNIFAIRGERFRDPGILLTGLDGLSDLNPEHLICCHGPSLSGAATIADEIELYRDGIQFLLDQTIRGINKGLLLDELASFVQLPEPYGQNYLTQQLYGLVEHHVKQTSTGLVGWFDGDESKLFALPPADRAQRLIAGFGGLDAVRSHVDQAIVDDDLRWALELATWLVRCALSDDGRADAGAPEDRARLGSILRTIAQRTTSANARNWCLTRARELEGLLDLSRFRTHRFLSAMVMGSPPAASVEALRVTYRPEHTPSKPETLAWRFDDGSSIALCQRNGVAAVVDPALADATLDIDLASWARLVGGKASLAELVDQGAAQSDDPDFVATFLARFEIGWRSPN